MFGLVRSQQALQARSVSRLLLLLTDVARASQNLCCKSSSGSNSGARTACAVAAAAPAVAVRWVEFGRAFEASLRAVTEAAQSGVVSIAEINIDLGALCADVLLAAGDSQSVPVQHMSLCGPEALAREQRQLYSLLSTVLKLGHKAPTGTKLCWGERAAGSCCLAAGAAAVLLLLPPPKGSAAAAAAAQQPATDYLPSLVIFGRCCLQWAAQLQQQTPELVLLASGALQQQQQLLLHEYSAAVVCIPGLRQRAGLMPGYWLENLVPVVLAWVGLLAHEAHAQLEAAGCAPKQMQQGLQQQLQVLLSATAGPDGGFTDSAGAAAAGNWGHAL
jgi:hypothetical protein